MAMIKIPKNPMHRCYSRTAITDGRIRSELIIIERKDMTFPSKDVSPDVYGAIEGFINDEGEVKFYFNLLRSDDQIFFPEFEFNEKFDRHVKSELRRAVYPKPMRETFEVHDELDGQTEAYLTSVWQARCLAEKFKFTADISFNGHSTMTADGLVEVTMIQPWSGRENRFIAQFSNESGGPDDYMGPDSLEGPLYFGKAT